MLAPTGFASSPAVRVPPNLDSTAYISSRTPGAKQAPASTNALVSSQVRPPRPSPERRRCMSQVGETWKAKIPRGSCEAASKAGKDGAHAAVYLRRSRRRKGAHLPALVAGYTMPAAAVDVQMQRGGWGGAGMCTAAFRVDPFTGVDAMRHHPEPREHSNPWMCGRLCACGTERISGVVGWTRKSGDLNEEAGVSTPPSPRAARSSGLRRCAVNTELDTGTPPPPTMHDTAPRASRRHTASAGAELCPLRTASAPPAHPHVCPSRRKHGAYRPLSGLATASRACTAPRGFAGATAHAACGEGSQREARTRGGSPAKAEKRMCV
ncbi:hypothetical protein B0H15DRAFT_947445 [Mycena belliarum]|uniref:Uncharacterized protein n=1 Tax=Mycena belliarum TaxID=1033014 RepID=A0AAD6U708_9AGAR|nr:hypothetical protein B0H15DRAFT_947445 [Mycena belliae]